MPQSKSGSARRWTTAWDCAPFDRAQGKAQGGAFRRTYIWPESNKDIVNSPELSLVVLDTGYAVGQTWDHVKPRVRVLLDHYGVGARIYRNTLVFLLPDEHEMRRVYDAARRYIALQGIARNYQGKGELSEQQEEDLARRLEEVQSQVPQTLAAAYRHIEVKIDARSESGIDADTVELRIRESLLQRSLDAKIETRQCVEFIET